MSKVKKIRMVVLMLLLGAGTIFQNCSKGLEVINQEQKNKLLASRILFAGGQENAIGERILTINSGSAVGIGSWSGDLGLLNVGFESPSFKELLNEVDIFAQKISNLERVYGETVKVFAASNMTSKSTEDLIAQLKTLHHSLYQNLSNILLINAMANSNPGNFRSIVSQLAIDLKSMNIEFSAFVESPAKLWALGLDYTKVDQNWPQNHIDMATAHQQLTILMNKSKLVLGQLNNVQSFANLGDLFRQIAPQFTKMLAAVTQMSQTQSPLMVHFNTPDSEAMRFSSPEAGVMFDLMGINAKPQPHSKNRVSWIEKPKGNFFVTLPDATGAVNGIDQLFGNNTVGPDARLSPDGFAALAKFDFNSDGFITRDDSIFDKLRLWQDDNRDGLAQSNELFCLSFLKVEVIDLGFDKNYFEMDQWGNQIRYKSVLKTSDQNLHPVFDVWLRFFD